MKHQQPPEELQKMQEWFGRLIHRPLDSNDCMLELSFDGLVMSKEAAKYITSSPTLTPEQRLQIYNQQYWWRLFGIMQTNFPFVLRLVGTTIFNQEIVVPYLLCYPPNHWSLNHLGLNLSKWIIKNCHSSNKSLIYEAAVLDEMVALASYEKEWPKLSAEFLTQCDPDILIQKPLRLQPHISLTSANKHLFHLRDQLIKEEADYWLTHALPVLTTDSIYYFIIFRNHMQNVAWKEISAEEYSILHQFYQQKSIEDVCEWMQTFENAVYTHLASHLQKWMQEWTHYGWLIFVPEEDKQRS